jgi:hypothetical protein
MGDKIILVAGTLCDVCTVKKSSYIASLRQWANKSLLTVDLGSSGLMLGSLFEGLNSCRRGTDMSLRLWEAELL